MIAQVKSMFSLSLSPYTYVESSNLQTVPGRASLQSLGGQRTLCLAALHQRHHRKHGARAYAETASVCRIIHLQISLLPKRDAQTGHRQRKDGEMSRVTLTRSRQQTLPRHVGAASLSLIPSPSHTNTDTPSTTPSELRDITAFTRLMAEAPSLR